MSHQGVRAGASEVEATGCEVDAAAAVTLALSCCCRGSGSCGGTERGRGGTNRRAEDAFGRGACPLPAVVDELAATRSGAMVQAAALPPVEAAAGSGGASHPVGAAADVAAAAGGEGRVFCKQPAAPAGAAGAGCCCCCWRTAGRTDGLLGCPSRVRPFEDGASARSAAGGTIWIGACCCCEGCCCGDAGEGSDGEAPLPPPAAAGGAPASTLDEPWDGPASPAAASAADFAEVCFCFAFTFFFEQPPPPPPGRFAAASSLLLLTLRLFLLQQGARRRLRRSFRRRSIVRCEATAAFAASAAPLISRPTPCFFLVVSTEQASHPQYGELFLTAHRSYDIPCEALHDPGRHGCGREGADHDAAMFAFWNSGAEVPQQPQAGLAVRWMEAGRL